MEENGVETQQKGKALVARVSPELHRRTRMEAFRIGVSLERYIVDSVSASLDVSENRPGLSIPTDSGVSELSDEEINAVRQFMRAMARRDEKAAKFVQAIRALLDAMDL